MISFLRVLTLFLVVFDPQIPFLPNGVGFSLLVVFIIFPFFIFKIRSKKVSQVFRVYLPLLCLFFCLLILILLKVIFNFGQNYEFLFSWFKGFVLFCSVCLCLSVFYDVSYLGGKKLIHDLVVVFVFNAVVNFVAGTYQEYFNFLSVFRFSLISDSLGGNPYRSSFISGSGYFSIGTSYGLAVLLVAFHLVRYNVKGFLFPLSIVLMSVAGFVAARTSFFAIFFSMVYMSLRRPVYLFFVSLLGLGLISLFLLLPTLQPYVLWMQSFFSDFDRSSSASHLLGEMYFWPGFDIFLMGRGVVNDGVFVYTDAGYMQDLLFGGLLFLILKILFVVFLFCEIKKVSLFFSILFCTSVLLFHMKGLFVYNNSHGMAVFYLTYFYFNCIDRRSV